jgi:large subunit ribosomal protein L21
MYAIVEEGGRQYKVEVGQFIKVNRLETKLDDIHVFSKVVMVRDDSGIKAGTDQLDGAKVSGRVIRLERGKKLLVFKKKRRKGYHKAKGHRQDLSVVKITDIDAGTGAFYQRSESSEAYEPLFQEAPIQETIAQEPEAQEAQAQDTPEQPESSSESTEAPNVSPEEES